MHLAPLIVDLSIILTVAAAMTLLFRWMKQPVVLGYLLAGIVIGPHTPPFQLVKDTPTIQTLAELGVIFLMFTLGLEFSFRKLTKVGLPAFGTAVAGITFFVIGGIFLGQSLGFGKLESLFLGCMLSISSTTIILKALEELNLKKQRFAQIIFGDLIVEDLFAILMLVTLSTLAQSETFSVVSLSFSAMKLLFIIGSWFIVGYFLIPRIMRQAGRLGNSETLTIVSLGLCLSLVVFADYFDYSPALGAFIMGSILAETSLIAQIEERMAPLKDLFGAIFFVSIGMLINPSIMVSHFDLILGLSAFIIVGKIISASLGALASGVPLKKSLQVGMSLTQIGEFSFIIAGLGVSTQSIRPELYPIIVAVSLLTTFTTPYFIRLSGPLAAMVDQKLPPNLALKLQSYGRWVEFNMTKLARHEALGQYVLRWLINAMVTTLIFLVVRQFGPKNVPGFRTGLLFLSLLFTLPFIWAMSFGHREPTNHSRKRIEVLPLLLTLILTGVLSSLFISWKLTLPLTVILLICAFSLSLKRLEHSYGWFEEKFLESFTSSSRHKEASFQHLVPWNGHLVTLKIHPNAQHVGKTLAEVHFRSVYGINIVAIRRGVQNIIAPGPQELLLPADDLVVLGTDENIERLRQEIENVSIKTEEAPQDFELRHLQVSDVPGLVGQTIRHSNIRERFHILILGIEREGKRVTTPAADEELKADDQLWLVGARGDLSQFIKDGLKN